MATLENDARLWHESEADRVRRIGNIQWWQELDSREGEKLVLQEQCADSAALVAGLRQERDEAIQARDDAQSVALRLGEARDEAIVVTNHLRQVLTASGSGPTHFANDVIGGSLIIVSVAPHVDAVFLDGCRMSVASISHAPSGSLFYCPSTSAGPGKITWLPAQKSAMLQAVEFAATDAGHEEGSA